ncbi:hypothetical protein Tco_0058749 [Tanacetum coccineum]
MIAPGSSRYSSNDMVHNHYLDEAKKKTQESCRNSEPSVMPSARSQSTANGSKPKPRINNQKSRNWPASKSSCWVSNGKIFTSSTTKVASEPQNGSNADITNQYESAQTLDVSAGTSNLSAGTSFNPKKEGLRVCLFTNSQVLAPPHKLASDQNSFTLGIHDHSNELSRSKLVPKVVPPADKTATSRQELELLFHYHITMLSSQAVNKSPTHYPCDYARTFRVILFSIHNDEWKSFQCHHQTALRRPYALSWKPCQGDSLNLPDHRIHKDGDGDASFQLKSDSLPHAHAQTTKTFYKHQDSRIMKAQELKTKTSAQTLIYKIFLQRYQVYQGRLLASFQDDANSLIPLSHGSFDVLVGMDQLSKRKFGIVSHGKVVRIPLEGDEILRVHGDVLMEVVKNLNEHKVIFRKEHQCRWLRREAWSAFEVSVGITEEGEVVTYLRFIANFIRFVKPITSLLRRIRCMEWGRTKKRLSQDFEESICVKLNISNVGLDALRERESETRRVRAMSMTIRQVLKDKILDTSQVRHLSREALQKCCVTGTTMENLGDALSIMERVKSRRVRGMILAAQSEAFKQENVLVEMLRGLNQQMERKGDESLYFMDRTWVLLVGSAMDEAHASRYLVHPGADKTYYNLRDMYCLRYLSKNEIESPWILSLNFQDNSKEWNSGNDQLRLRWITYLVVLADTTGSVRDAIGFDYIEDIGVLPNLKALCKPLEFEVGDRVLLGVTPWKGVFRFGKKGKLAPRYVGPFEMLKRISLVAYRLRLPEELN